MGRRHGKGAAAPRPPRVLIVTRAVPGADSSAGERRLVHVSAMLAERATVDLVSVGTDRPGDEADRIRALRIERGVHVPYGGLPVDMVRTLRGRRYGLVVLEAWDVAAAALPLLRDCQPHALLAVDSVDLHFLRNARAAATTGREDPELEASTARELAAYRSADVRIFVSEAERDLYEGLPGAVRSANVVIPIVVEEQPHASRSPQRGEVVFVGPMWHAPNHDGVTWFCSEVWGEVRRSAPEARLRIIGSNAWGYPLDTSALTECPGVTVEGFVPDLRRVYATATVVVAPLRFGAGMKGKVCEAMAAGVPVVTTTVGAEGIRATPGRDLLVADDPGDFARAVVTVLGDGQRAAAVAAAGAAAIARQCGTAVVRPEVHALLDMVDPGGPPLRERFPPRQLPRLAAAAAWRLGRRLQAQRQRASR